MFYKKYTIINTKNIQNYKDFYIKLFTLAHILIVKFLPLFIIFLNVIISFEIASPYWKFIFEYLKTSMSII